MPVSASTPAPSLRLNCLRERPVATGQPLSSIDPNTPPKNRGADIGWQQALVGAVCVGLAFLAFFAEGFDAGKARDRQSYHYCGALTTFSVPTFPERIESPDHVARRFTLIEDRAGSTSVICFANWYGERITSMIEQHTSLW